MGIGNGINFSVQGVLQALSNLNTTVVGSLENLGASLAGPWRPPQWSAPPQTSITVPGPVAPAQGSPANLGPQDLGLSSSATGSNLAANQALGGVPTFGITSAIVSQPTTPPDTIYVFDGVLKIEHTQEVELTKHPAQSGANISDHAFVKPARVSLDVLMSDVMSSYTTGQWTGQSSKSVNAYQTMLNLQLSRTAVTVTTRLNVYKNMIIVAIHTPDDYKTKNGLRSTITFEQIFTGLTSTLPASARPQTTQVTSNGLVPTTPLPGVVGSNYEVAPPPIPVTGSGNWSSYPATENPIGS